MGFKKWLGIEAPTAPAIPVGPRTRTVRGLSTCAVAAFVWLVLVVTVSNMKPSGLGLGALFGLLLILLICWVAFIYGFISAVRGAIGWAKQSDKPRDAATASAGWLTDPTDSTSLRYWDGQQWTDQRAARQVDPPT